jgi:hypothetical protein
MVAACVAICLCRVRAKSHSSRTRLASSSSRERRSRSSMLPSLSAGTFECGRPQIVFERGIIFVITLSQNFARHSKFAGCVRKPAEPPRAGALFHRPNLTPTGWALGELDANLRPRSSSIISDPCTPLLCVKGKSYDPPYYRYRRRSAY